MIHSKTNLLEPSPSYLPRWRGFNLLGKYSLHQPAFGSFLEWDFKMISEWGFNFVRIPMDYRLWIKDGDWNKINPEAFRDLDQAVEWADFYGLHACLNIHRAPGYCINLPPEPGNLWTDDSIQAICAAHWVFLARKYKGITSSKMSFDLINEPNGVDNPTYARFVQKMAEAIREVDPNRLIIADGTEVGTRPVPELISLGVAQSTRGYQPMEISHYQAPWFKEGVGFTLPDWPLKKEKEIRDKAWLKRKWIDPWKNLESQGAGVFVGEWGVYNKTPHSVSLAWMRDQLELWKEAGWGWALWNFRGDFGPLDSQRADVVYEDFDGHKIDRKMLELLQKN